MKGAPNIMLILTVQKYSKPKWCISPSLFSTFMLLRDALLRFIMCSYIFSPFTIYYVFFLTHFGLSCVFLHSQNYNNVRYPFYNLLCIYLHLHPKRNTKSHSPKTLASCNIIWLNPYILKVFCLPFKLKNNN